MNNVNLTEHARDRMHLFRLTEEQVKELFNTAIETEQPHPDVKKKKYNTADKIKYRNNGIYNFVYKIKDNKEIIITIGNVLLTKTYNKYNK